MAETRFVCHGFAKGICYIENTKVKMHGDKAGAMGKGPGGTATIKSDELQKRFFTMGINDVLCCGMVRKGGLIKRRLGRN